MDPHRGTGPAAVTHGSEDATSAAGGRPEVRLTPALVVLVVLLGTLAGLRPAVASPTVTGVLWAGLVTIVVLGVAWPLVSRRSRRLVIHRCPTDVVEDTPFGLHLAIAGTGLPIRAQLHRSVGSLRPATDLMGSRDDSREGVVLGAGESAAAATVAHRGVYRTLPVRVCDTGPFGLLRVNRVLNLPLPAPLYVGPRAVAVSTELEPDGSGSEVSSRARVAMVGDTVRTVRPYVSGDPAHLVHWPTSAHAGDLMVMELEPPAERLLAVTVDLRSGAAGRSDEVEHAVRRAAGAVLSGLDDGIRVVLCTAQIDGPLTAEVRSVLQARRRLAAATPGVPGTAPAGCASMVFAPLLRADVGEATAGGHS